MILHMKKILKLSLFSLTTLLCGCNPNISNNLINNSDIPSEENIIKTVNFKNYKFVYYDSNYGEIYNSLTNEKISSTSNYLFKENNIKKLDKSYTFIETMECIGFPLFIGLADGNTLDFGIDNQNIYRCSFDKQTDNYNDYQVLDYNDPLSWVDSNKKILPSLDEINKIELNMSLDEVVYLIGKPQNDFGYGRIGFDFKLNNGSTFKTWWHRINGEGTLFLNEMWIE